MVKLIFRYLKYLGTSLAGTIVDTLVLWVLSDLVFRDKYWEEYILSPIISFQCAVVVNFMIFYFYVWRDRTREYSGIRVFFRRFISFDLSTTTVFLIRLALLLLIEKIFGWDVVLCNIVAMCFSGIINFLMNNLVIFKKDSNVQKKSE